MGVVQGTVPPVEAEPAMQNSYLRKHQLVPLRIAAPPASDLGLIVVIPCYDEPDLIGTLESLWACVRPGCGVEVIVVVNASDGDGPDVHERNLRTIAQATEWIAGHRDASLAFHVCSFPGLPARHAGVGLARKLGMDGAVARFAAAGRSDGVIACLDADCGCDPDYLRAIARHFGAHPKTPGCSIYFEHPLDSVSGPDVRTAIANYELHLRCYVHGLRFARSPYAHYTVGSCMAVRSAVYEEQGGMNRRKAGEDFYFLQKVMRLGGFTQLSETRVIPAPRVSTRVPFGTGRTMKGLLDNGDGTFLTYAPEVFRDLGALLSLIEPFSDPEQGSEQRIAALAPTVVGFLQDQGFAERLAEMRAKTASIRTFAKRFHQWFNAIRTLKFIHYATAHAYPKVPVEQTAATLLQWRGAVDAAGL